MTPSGCPFTRRSSGRSPPLAHSRRCHHNQNNEAPDDIVTPTRWKRNDEAHRLRWVALRRCDPGAKGNGTSDNHRSGAFYLILHFDFLLISFPVRFQTLQAVQSLRAGQLPPCPPPRSRGRMVGLNSLNDLNGVYGTIAFLYPMRRNRSNFVACELACLRLNGCQIVSNLSGCSRISQSE